MLIIFITANWPKISPNLNLFSGKKLTAQLMFRERVTVYTQYSSEPDSYFEPQFVMKGQGKTKAMKEVQENAPRTY